MDRFILPHDHSDILEMEVLRRELIKMHRFDSVAEIFSQLGDPIRVRIFWLLSHQEECVVNISAILNMSSPAISHHLHSLLNCGLLTCRRKGKEVFYRANDTQKCRLLHRTIEEIMEVSCPEADADFHGSPEAVIRCVHEYLTEHLSDRITIETLSKQFLINPTTLKVTFKKIYGNSIAAHIREHRMEASARLLETTAKSIAEIARMVGYNSQSRFTAAFKETYGELPTEYRRHSINK